MTPDPTLATLHHALIRALLDEGACPDNPTLADRLHLSPAALATQLQDLAAIHGVVLHPHTPAPWIVHPFSTVPTLNWIEAPTKGWWAPCLWCALGVATLVGGETRIHTRLAGETEPLTIPVQDGIPANEDLLIHFAIPPARAWDNVHQHCALVLPFRSPEDIAAWSTRHRLPHGEAVPIQQTARLARAWYGRHADPDWRKWSVPEAQSIFHDAGLTSPFWSLGPATGKF